jgi:hypothetical protein
MMNKVGDKALSPQDAERLLEQLGVLVARLREIGITLTSDERRRLLRPRRGAGDHIRRVAELASKYGLSVADAPLDGMKRDLGLGEQLLPFEDQLRVALTIAEDTAAQADSEAWQAFLMYYALLRAMADRNADVAVDLEPVTRFMATRARREEPPAGAPA